MESLEKRITNYFNYIVHNGLNLQDGQFVEIVGSSYVKNYIELIKEACLKAGASFVYVKYTDGDELQYKISNGYHNYILDDIKYYQYLINKKFTRIVLTSPFTIPLSLNKNDILEYKNCQRDLAFVNDYFKNLESQRTIASIANCYWAAKLQISENELWERILSFQNKSANMDVSWLDSLNIKKLKFETNLGTNLSVELTDDFKFQNKNLITKDGIIFEPNIPCLEIYTSPIKYGVNGILYSSKPLYYKGNIIDNYYVKFKDGHVIDQTLGDLIMLDDTMYYAGEIALVNLFDKTNYYATILNENTGCHLALGYAYEYGISDLRLINSSDHHVDLVFGDESTNCIGITKNGEKIILFKDGKYVGKTYD